MKILILLLLTICCHYSNSQSVINIPQNALNLSAAVQLAQSGDTIVLSSGIYADSVHIFSKNLIFRGDPNGGSILSPGLNEKSFVLINADIEISHITFDDFQQNSPPPNFAISATNSNVKVNHCRFINLYSPISLFSGNLEINNSVFSGTRGNAGVMQNIGKFLIYNNLMYGLENTAISINRAHGQFFNNTLVGDTPTQHFGIIINSDSITHIYNNIFEGFGIGIQLTASDSAEFNALRIFNNNIHNVTAPYWYEYNENLSLPLFSGPLTPNPGNNEISTPPNFVSPALGDFNLQPGSPCIDNGTDAYLFPINFDLAGNERIIGIAPDIGAYEFSMFTELKEETFSVKNTMITIYPNPTRDKALIKFNKIYSGKLELLDITGKIISEMRLSGIEEFQIDIPTHEGLYLLKLTNDEGTILKKVLKLN